MKNLTKQAIVDSFLKLLRNRPLGQITVKDIVEDCGVNRNTFYYHFEDIPSLVREIITAEAKRLLAQSPVADDVEGFLNASLALALRQKKLVYHIYTSADRDLFERYLSEICEHLAKTYINSVSEDHRISDSDKAMMIRLHKAVYYGTIMEWISDGMSENILDDVHRICTFLDGYIDILMKRCEEENPYK